MWSPGVVALENPASTRHFARPSSSRLGDHGILRPQPPGVRVLPLEILGRATADRRTELVLPRDPRTMEWLNYRHLLYFWTVAREGTVSKASASLRLAQPTISG